MNAILREEFRVQPLGCSRVLFPLRNALEFRVQPLGCPYVLCPHGIEVRAGFPFPHSRSASPPLWLQGSVSIPKYLSLDIGLSPS